MNSLPEIFDHQGKKAVSARELYDSLGFDIVNWARWYHKNITKSPFAIENQDWAVFFIEKKTPDGGRPSRDFALSLDFAKRLAMMARTEAGERVRDYFIQCEEATKLPENDDHIIHRAFGILQQRTATLEARVKVQQRQIEDQTPKVEYVETVLSSTSLITTTVIAKELGMSAYMLNKLLYHLKVMFPQNGTWVLYAPYQNNDYTKTRTHAYVDNSGFLRTSIQTVWTEKGRMFIHQKVKEHNRLLKGR